MPELETYITVDEGNVTAPHIKRKDRQCGSPGWYMYLPASFVLQAGRTVYGYHGNFVLILLVHAAIYFSDFFNINVSKMKKKFK